MGEAVKMLNNPQISIILPVYNTKDYLNRCLKSLCEQTYKNIEIIAVDDGSTDGSAAILDEFANKDERIRAVHKSNGGESSARNVGLQMMTGEYVGFMDCDDWIEPDMYDTLVSYAVEKNVDLVASPWYKDTAADSKVMQNKLHVTSDVFDREQLLNYIYKRDSYQGFAYMWNKLYRKDLFYDEEGKLILFPEDLELGGDVLYLGRLALNAGTAVYVNKPFYHYYQREVSEKARRLAGSLQATDQVH
jgi:glycosyltransferase involved in cell wall biosynthesis